RSVILFQNQVFHRGTARIVRGKELVALLDVRHPLGHVLIFTRHPPQDEWRRVHPPLLPLLSLQFLQSGPRVPGLEHTRFIVPDVIPKVHDVEEERERKNHPRAETANSRERAGVKASLKALRWV